MIFIGKYSIVQLEAICKAQQALDVAEQKYKLVKGYNQTKESDDAYMEVRFRKQFLYILCCDLSKKED